jgi:hypothetical protein
MKRVFTLIALILALAVSSHAQGVAIGNAASTLIGNTGRPIAGAGVAICAPVATTAASVTSNVATITLTGNAITQGFAQGATVMVSGFTGGDTYFNGGSLTSGQIVNGFTLLSVTSTTITFALVHANASTSSNGVVLQEGNTTTPCAGLSTVYTDPGELTVTANPFATDGLGNWQAFGTAGTYFVQFYGPQIVTTIKTITGGVPTNPLIITSLTTAKIDKIIYVDGSVYPTLASALAAVPAGGAIIIDTLVEAFTVNPFASTTNPVWVQLGAGIWTTTVPIVLSANQWITGAGPQYSQIKAVAGFSSTTLGVVTLGNGVQSHSSFARDLGINCNAVATCTGLVFDGAQNPAGADNVTITNYTADGVRLQQTSASTSGVKLSNMWMYSVIGSSPSGSGINVSAFAGDVVVENVTQASDHPFPGPAAFTVGGGTGQITFIGSAGEGVTDMYHLTGTSATTVIIGVSQNAGSSPGVNTVHVGAGVSNYELINVEQGNSSNAALVDDQRSYTCTGGLTFLVVSGGSTKYDFGNCQAVGWIRTPATTVTKADLIQLQTGFLGSNRSYDVFDDSGNTQFGVTNDGRILWRGNQTGAFTQILASDTLTASRTAQHPNGPSATVMVAALVTTAAATDNVTIQGMASGGHCTLTPTNAAAATNIATTYISAKAANQITVSHAATANMNYDIACTSN